MEFPVWKEVERIISCVVMMQSFEIQRCSLSVFTALNFKILNYCYFANMQNEYTCKCHWLFWNDNGNLNWMSGLMVTAQHIIIISNCHYIFINRQLSLWKYSLFLNQSDFLYANVSITRAKWREKIPSQFFSCWRIINFAFGHSKVRQDDKKVGYPDIQTNSIINRACVALLSVSEIILPKYGVSV